MSKQQFKHGEEQQRYSALLGRINDAINQWRLLAHEAHQRGDKSAYWEAVAWINDLENKRDSMRKPIV